MHWTHRPRNPKRRGANGANSWVWDEFRNERAEIYSERYEYRHRGADWEPEGIASMVVNNDRNFKPEIASFKVEGSSARAFDGEKKRYSGNLVSVRCGKRFDHAAVR